MDPVQAEPMKRCPFCGEQILAIAIKCKHCGSMLGQLPSSPPPAFVAPMPAARTEGASEPARRTESPRAADIATASPTQARDPIAMWPGTLWFMLGGLPGFIFIAGVIGAGARRFSGGLGGLLPGGLWKLVSVYTILVACLFGIPAALWFASSMRKTGDDGWERVLRLAGVLTIAFTAAFWLSISVLADMDDLTIAGWRNLFLTGAATAVGGTVLAHLKGRRAEQIPLTQPKADWSTWQFVVGGVLAAAIGLGIAIVQSGK